MTDRWHFESYLPTAVSIIEEAVQDGIDQVLADILEQAKDGVPKLSGDLAGTGRYEREGTDGAVGFGGNIGTDTGWSAIINHEDYERNHPGGGHAGYLAIPFLAARTSAGTTIANVVRDRLRG